MSEHQYLLVGIRNMREESRKGVGVAVNASLTLLYWRVGSRISEEVIKGERAGYGEKIVSTLSRQLMEEYGRGFSDKNQRVG
jgi:hypothetical protein